ncbi:hypothetical protein [Parvularcula dongshanensis]|uniref:Uncharacterized protein n=1 Tax=Parvularcula dongshanensis TaxID=1173995 RepID=A0A840I4M4_9PROT|nr:hypothetical protein [Parvularcula dongshanensis]MBB4659737.1 hypothetical protein [Parvularcula dongshanensis]
MGRFGGSDGLAARARRRGGPVVGALAINFGLGAVLLLAFDPEPPKRRPDAIPVTIVAVVPETPRSAVVRAREGEGAEPNEAPPEPAEDRPDPAPAPPPAPTPRSALPDVSLPDADVTQGPSGLLGIDCNAVFEEEERAAACAGGAEVPGWQNAIRHGEDWSRTAEDRWRGGVPRPAYGPDPLEALGEAWTVWENAPQAGVPPDEARALREEARAKAYRQRQRGNSPMTSSGASALNNGGASDYLTPQNFIGSGQDGAEGE